MNTSVTPSSDSRLQRYLAFLAEDPENLLLRSEIFDLALAAGAHDAAEQQIEFMLQRHPREPQWEHRLALLRIAQKRYAEANVIIDELLACNHGEPVLRYNQAYVAFREGHYEKARAVLSALMQEEGAPTGTLALLLQVLHRLGAVNEGLALFEGRLVGGVPPAAYGVASLMAIDAGRIAQAGTWSEHALRAEPMQLEALVARASVALAAQDSATAMPYLERALQVNPADGRTWSAHGMALLLRMECEQAVQSFKKAVASMPDHIGTWHGMAWSQLMLKDLAGARQSFEQALAIDRNFGESYGGLAVVLALQGQDHAAREHIDKALRLDSRSLAARYAEAILSGEANDAERFRRLAERVLAGRTAFDGSSMAELVLRRR